MNAKSIITTFGLISLFTLTTSYVNKRTIDEYHLRSGINLTCFVKQEFSSSEKKAIDRIVNNGFSTIVLNPIYNQETIHSSKIEQQSAFDNSHLEDIIDYAQGRGLDVVLKPLINVKSKESRTIIMPDDVDEWFKSYNSIMFNLAKIGEKHSIYGMIMMCELDSLLINNSEKFKETIYHIKETGFNGKLSAAVVYYDETCNNKIEFLNTLQTDFIGVDFYVSMINDRLSKEEKFYEVLYHLENIQSIANKPLLIAEVGFRSVEKGNRRPMYNYKLKGKLDLELQRESYKNFIRAYTNKSLNRNKLEGIFFWITDSYLYTEDILNIPVRFSVPWEIGYTPFNKPAEEVMKKFNKERVWLKYDK